MGRAEQWYFLDVQSTVFGETSTMEKMESVRSPRSSSIGMIADEQGRGRGEVQKEGIRRGASTNERGGQSRDLRKS